MGETADGKQKSKKAAKSKNRSTFTRSTFVDIELPFDKLILTSYGMQKAVNRPIPQDRITHIGLTVIADKETDFRVEIESVKAIPRINDVAVEDFQDRQRQLNRERRLKL